MKAKEYAKEIVEANYSDDAIFNMIKCLVGEIRHLNEQRNCQSMSAINSVFKEIDQKYRVVCKLVSVNGHNLNVDGFKSFQKKLYSEEPDVLSLDYFKD
jgi:hypothetical protein